MEFNTADERIEEIKRVWKPGLSAGQIALRVGYKTSRNAIVGMFSRHAKALFPCTLRAPVTLKTRKKKSPTKHIVQSTKRKEVDIIIPRSVDACAAPIPLRLSMLALRNGQCRWPVNDDGTQYEACGNPSGVGQSFCTYHRNIAYVPYQRNRSKKK